MSQLARLRRLLARRPWLYWATAAALALLIAAQVQASLAALASARQAWGTPVTVWVATAPAERGHPVAAEARDYPAAMVPPSALTAPPTGVAARLVEEGEVLTAGAVGGSDAGRPGDVVVALPPAGMPSVVVGDVVVLFGNGAEVCDGTVTGVGGDAVEVAVPPGCAAALAAHLQAGTAMGARRV